MRKKRHKVFLLLLFTLLLTCLFTTTVFAAGKNLFEVADDIIRDVYSHIVGISTVLACLMTAFAIISAKVSNNQHKSDQAWDWLKRIWLVMGDSKSDGRHFGIYHTSVQRIRHATIG